MPPTPAPAPGAPPSALHRSDYFGAAHATSHNLIGDGTGSTGFSSANGDQVGTAASPIDPHLGPLPNNGGPMLTLALLPGSPAIDAGAPITTVAQDAAPTDTTIFVADAAVIASTPAPVLLLIDGEQMLVTGVDLANGTITVQRGPNPVALAQGDPIAFAVDQRGLPRTVNGTTDIGAVEYQADLAVTMRVSPAAARPGGTVKYTITVTNLGPDSAAAVLTDALPANTTFVSFAGPGPWTKTLPAQGSAGTVTASTAALAPARRRRSRWSSRSPPTPPTR